MQASASEKLFWSGAPLLVGRFFGTNGVSLRAKPVDETTEWCKVKLEKKPFFQKSIILNPLFFSFAALFKLSPIPDVFNTQKGKRGGQQKRGEFGIAKQEEFHIYFFVRMFRMHALHDDVPDGELKNTHLLRNTPRRWRRSSKASAMFNAEKERKKKVLESSLFHSKNLFFLLYFATQKARLKYLWKTEAKKLSLIRTQHNNKKRRRSKLL